MPSGEKITFFANISIILLFIGVAAKVLLPGVLSVFLPFLIGYFIATIIRKPVKLLNSKTKIPRSVLSTVFVLGTVGLLTYGIWSGANRLLSEVGKLISSLGESDSAFNSNIDRIVSAVNSASSKIPALRESGEGIRRISEAVDKFVKDSVNGFLGKMSEGTGNFVAKTLRRLPETFLYIIVTVIASVYISSGFEKINAFLLSLIPDKYRNKAEDLIFGIRKTGKCYFKAYSVIYIVTFAELFFGLAVLRVKYSFVLALLIAFVDILPVFGVGTILIPWAIVSLVLGNSKMFVSLLLLYAIISVVRQVIEPKIVGESIGLSPLLTLVSMFAGYRFFGIFGMILLPLASAVAFGVYGNYKNEEKISGENTIAY